MIVLSPLTQQLDRYYTVSGPFVTFKRSIRNLSIKFLSSNRLVMKFSILIIGLVFSLHSSANTLDSNEVQIREVIDQLFVGMRQGDSSLVNNCFTSSATLNSADHGEMKNSPIEKFMEAIGTPHDRIWDERISNVVIQLDQGLAHAWMDYSFYVGEQFSHCGVNSMILIRTNDGWKIQSIVDTRRRTDCN